MNEGEVAITKALGNLSGGRKPGSNRKSDNASTLGGRINQTAQALSKDGDDRRGKERLGKYSYGQGHDRGKGI